QKYIVDVGGMGLPLVVALAAGYNTLTSQGPVKDYRTTFLNHNSQDEVNSCCNYRQSCGKNCCSFRGTLLFIILTPVFVSHTLTMPALCTGTIDNAGEEYTTTVMVKALVGLLLGGYAGYQYTYD